MSNEQAAGGITGKQVKRIDIEKGVFEANGKIYRIEADLSMSRYAEYQVLEKQLPYGLDAKGMFGKLRELFDLLDQQKFAQCSVMVYDLMRGAQQLMTRENTALRMCALFMNTDDEDRTIITEGMITSKINDWREEGIAASDFFKVAGGSVNGFSEIYQTITRITSGQEQPGLKQKIRPVE